MARYLLNAPDEDLQAWKALAKERGQTLAKFLREAAHASARIPAPAAGPSVEPDEQFRTILRKPAQVDKKAVTPDWKK